MDIGKDSFESERKKHSLDWIAQVFTDGPNTPGWNGRHAGFTKSEACYNPIAMHVKIFQEQVEESMKWDALKINCQAGCDYWTPEEANEFFGAVLPWIDQFDTPVTFETHRGKTLYSPWVTRNYVQQWSETMDIKLCADYSHYVNVAECHPSFKPLQDVFQFLNPYVKHIHARVGFEEGPQVNDPRDPKWASHVEAHMGVWEDIWRHHEKRGEKYVTVTPEHGPQDYQHCMPYTQEDLAGNWQVNDWVGERIRERFDSGNWRGEPIPKKSGL